MGPFAIYFLVVTGIYIAYYTVIITLDLYGKKGVKKDDAEIIAVDGKVEDTSVAVRELSGGGYSYEPVVPHSDTSEEEPVTVPPDSSAGGSSPGDSAGSGDHSDDSDDADDNDELYGEESPEDTSSYYDMLCEIKENAEELSAIIPEVEEEFGSDEYIRIISQPRSKQTKIFNQLLEL